MAQSRWNAKKGGGRETATKGEVTRTAGSGYRNPDMKCECLSVEVTPTESEDNEKVLPIEGAVDCSQGSTSIEEDTAGKDAPSTEMEGYFVMCEIGGEQ